MLSEARQGGSASGIAISAAARTFSRSSAVTEENSSVKTSSLLEKLE